MRFPFAYIEHRSPPIPDEIQLKIIGFSFPEDEQMMKKYAQFSRGGVDVSLNTARSALGNVKNLNQIGRYDLTMVLLYQKKITSKVVSMRVLLFTSQIAGI